MDTTATTYQIQDHAYRVAEARHHIRQAIAYLQSDCTDETAALGGARDALMYLTRGVDRDSLAIDARCKRCNAVVDMGGDHACDEERPPPLDLAYVQLTDALTALGHVSAGDPLTDIVELVSRAAADIRLAGRARYLAWAIAEGRDDDATIALADAWVERRSVVGPYRRIGDYRPRRRSAPGLDVVPAAEVGDRPHMWATTEDDARRAIASGSVGACHLDTSPSGVCAPAWAIVAAQG